MKIYFTEIDNVMMKDPDDFILLMFLRRHHWGRPFYIAKEMHAASSPRLLEEKELRRSKRECRSLTEFVRQAPISLKEDHRSPGKIATENAEGPSSRLRKRAEWARGPSRSRGKTE
ncbi:hypothetical protein OZ411_29645 [Bradyrhizobium sp. Arg237L]|uniref:hypothetical protein n=1 Tax=Bradyrhizobium sp. Arg237L TaxID=3003352 RepID=UPI00249EDB3E|nr:hypothetical protein [Bradyrhizobium sp. Arg237L]MDI4236981.1 hypothetical protein [Bradyrhizobium sp. Arg237L]